MSEKTKGHSLRNDRYFETYSFMKHNQGFKIKRSKRDILWPLILLAVCALLRVCGIFFPNIIEHFYSLVLYKWISTGLSVVFGWIPFGVGQLLIPVFVVSVTVTLIVAARRRGPGGFFVSILKIISVTVFSFFMMWGLNYARQPLPQKMAFYDTTISHADLVNTTEFLIQETNAKRTLFGAAETPFFEAGLSELLRLSSGGYETLYETMPYLRRTEVRIKPFITPEWMSYMGISGCFLFFTGEGNVNTNMTHLEIAFAMLHEDAHRRGYAREDEANFLAYLSGRNHPEAFISYAASLNGLIYALNALRAASEADFQAVYAQLSQETRRDITAIGAYWDAYDGVVSQVADAVNNVYLQANMVTEGTDSYNQVVNLLILSFKNRLLE